jgi:hypothetical protein
MKQPPISILVSTIVAPGIWLFTASYMVTYSYTESADMTMPGSPPAQPHLVAQEGHVFDDAKLPPIAGALGGLVVYVGLRGIDALRRSKSNAVVPRT